MLYDLDAAIETVEAQIEDLKQQRATLMEAKGTLEALGVTPIEPKPEDAATDPERRTRKEAMVAFLELMGPQKRSDIVARTEIPAGTVSYELNDKETFIRLDDGRWDLRANHPEPPQEDEALPDPIPELTEDDIPF